MWIGKRVVRNFDAGDLFELFFVAAVSSVVFIRFFLYLTGYPQIGGDSFHIAHMLWGGLIMMLSIFLLLGFLNKPVMRFAAILGGIGFGTFIDELGKFITRDNNYFYEPAVAFIYIIFVLLYMGVRAFEKAQVFSQKEYLVNSLEFLEEVALHDLDREEQRKALLLLQHADQSHPLVKALEDILSKTQAIEPENTWVVGLKRTLHEFYLQIIQNRYFPKIFIWFFIFNTAVILFGTTRLLLYLFNNFNEIVRLQLPQIGFYQAGEFLSSLLSGAFVVVGATYIYRDRLKSYYWFKRSVLVSIFLTQFFIFYREQLSAIYVLVVNVAILVILQYMITQELVVQKKTPIPAS